MALLAEVEPKCLGKLIVQGGWGVGSCGNYVVGLFVFLFYFLFFSTSSQNSFCQFNTMPYC